MPSLCDGGEVVYHTREEGLGVGFIGLWGEGWWTREGGNDWGWWELEFWRSSAWRWVGTDVIYATDGGDKPMVRFV